MKRVLWRPAHHGRPALRTCPADRWRMWRRPSTQAADGDHRRRASALPHHRQLVTLYRWRLSTARPPPVLSTHILAATGPRWADVGVARPALRRRRQSKLIPSMASSPSAKTCRQAFLEERPLPMKEKLDVRFPSGHKKGENRRRSAWNARASALGPVSRRNEAT